MGGLGPIVGIWLGIVGNTWQDRSTGSTIAFQLVGDDPEWLLALTAQQSAKEPLGCTLIAARLQQNIDDITILIHGTPKILLPAVDSDEEFVQIPGITEASLFLLKTSGIVGPEFPAPLSDGFLRKYIPASVVNYSLKSRFGASPCNELAQPKAERHVPVRRACRGGEYGAGSGAASVAR